MLTELESSANPAVLPVVPMKPLSECKTRLSRVMSPQDREDLTIGMLRRVLLAIRGADVDPFWVIGGDDRVRNLSRTLGATWVEDLGRNLNDTLTKSFESARLREVSALYLPGDLPFIKPADIHQLIRSAQHQHNITLSPARRDGGTNAILVPLRPDTVLPPRTRQQQLSQARRHGRPYGCFRRLLLQRGHGL